MIKGTNCNKNGKKLICMEWMIMKKIVLYLVLIVLGIGVAQADTMQKSYLVPIKGEINSALVTYVNNAINEAEANNASQIIFEIDTYGGLVDSAEKISNSIINTSIPTVCYIKNNALSAGVLISISGDKVIANRTINIGSAETRPKEEKYISAWKGKLRTVAKQKGRNAEIIAGMADADLEIKDIKEKGKLLNLTADEALKYGIVDEVVADREELYKFLDIQQSNIVELKYNFRTNVARFTNSIYISTILISLGIIGIVGEVFTTGFGLFGSIGIFSFALFFAGKFIAGHAGWGILILFIAGIVLLGIEIAIPGFGISGITGISCIVLSILLSSSSPVRAAISFSIAVVMSIIVLTILMKFMPKSNLLDHIILKNEQTKDIGYVSHSIDKSALLGREGEALTLLRPAGTVLIGDEKIDVVSEGEYITKGSKVRVIAVEGNKVVVRKINI